MEYLGYIVNETGISPIKKKLEALKNFKPPSTQKDLLHFLGALNYYRSSFKGLIVDGKNKSTAELLQPLYNAATAKLEKVTLETVWKNSVALRIAFENAKKLLANATTLHHPNPQYPLALFVDASDKAIGSSLEMQTPDGLWRPLNFFSKHLTSTQQKYSVFKKELLAAHQSLRHFLPEIKGQHLVIFSDHLPLCQAMDKEIPLHDPQTYRQIMEISQFTQDIRHISSQSNLIADWLSRGGANINNK